jgi:uncharacterized protein (DUF2236 family)
MTRETNISQPQIDQRVFSPETMIWKVDREMVLLAAGGRALLMQLAHPKVAAGVAEHSDFKKDPLGRLHRTMSAMWSIVFDDASQAHAALQRIKEVHTQVRGTISREEPLAAGIPYHALDPELLLWVHATLIDSAMVAYGLFVKPLTANERSAYYQDTKKLARLFEIPQPLVPTSLADYQSYLGRMLASDAISVGPTARSLATEILYPRPWILKPAAPLFRLITAGLLTERLRDGYALVWNEGRERMFHWLATTIRILIPLAPTPLRVVSNARRAEKKMLPHS